MTSSVQRSARRPRQGHGLAASEGEELLDPHAEQVAERPGVAAEAHVVVLVADPGEEGDQHLRAGLGGRRDGGGVLVAQEVEGGHHDEPVCREVRSRVHDVGGDALVAQQPVDRLAPPVA